VLSASELFTFLQVLVINIVMSGDNVIVIGMVAGRVAPEDRRRVIGWGMGAAIGLRIVLALVALDLLAILGLTLAGGILLLWVAWRLYRDIVSARAHHGKTATRQEHGAHAVPFGRAIMQVAIADISMSVDNALAVAGAANQNVPVLIVGLVLSVAFMGIAATYVAKLLQRYPSLSWIGVLLVLYIALEMIWRGSGDIPELLRRLTFA
jgi:YjbE family integral membrane protein